MLTTKISKEQKKLFQHNGYTIIKNFCSDKEVDKLLGTALQDKNLVNFTERQSKKSCISSWFTPGDDIFGYLERSEKVVNSIGQLLESDSPVCHIHSKLMQKEPLIGGKWEWHQDYAYWYTNKFLSADKMVSVMVALTHISKENGGSQIIKGSHKLGRLFHSFEGEKVGADMEKVNTALETLELVYIELEAGDALFFHSNLLHRSDPNLSGYSTWANVSCYSTLSNLAKKQIFSSWHTPVEMVLNEAILEGDKKILISDDLLKTKGVNNLKNTVWDQLVAIA